mmetsp:Transcript_12678/g.26973  ORF Transcript_12678/g.26973 Transcript_12678/m.26973 type:complete len:276 (+) Transcript_12678:637-1464(+)
MNGNMKGLAIGCADAGEPAVWDPAPDPPPRRFEKSNPFDGGGGTAAAPLAGGIPNPGIPGIPPSCCMACCICDMARRLFGSIIDLIVSGLSSIAAAWGLVSLNCLSIGLLSISDLMVSGLFIIFCIICCIIGFSIIWMVDSRLGTFDPAMGFAHGLAPPAAPPPAPGAANGFAPGIPPMLDIRDANGLAPAPIPAAPWLEFDAGEGAGAPQGLGIAVFVAPAPVVPSPVPLVPPAVPPAPPPAMASIIGSCTSSYILRNAPIPPGIFSIWLMAKS